MPPQQTRNAANAATLKRRTSAATRKSGAVEQIRNGATVRENDATLRGINAQVCENDARGREIHAQRRRNDAGQCETKKPTDGELFECRQIISGNMYAIVMELWLPFSAHNDLVPKHESFYRVHLAYEHNDLQPRHFELELQAEPPLPAVERQLVEEQQLARV